MNEYTNTVINLAFCVEPLSDKEISFVVSGYNEHSKDELVALATKKKVLPVVGKMMLSLHVDEDYWKEKYEFFKKRNLEVIELIAGIFSSFKEFGVNRICVFENFGAMLAAESDIALYSSGDVDLFADVSQKNKIITVMESLGYFPTIDDGHRRNISTEFVKEDGIIRVNIAWKPLRRYLLPITLNAAEYFKWDEMKFYKETEIRIPEPETLLYMCFLRIAVHGYSRSPDIRLYIDTFNSTRNNPDWNKVMDWAESDNVKTKFVTVAVIAHDLIKLQIPRPVLDVAEKDIYTQRILKETYDFENHTLIYDPTGLKLLKVEAASDQRNIICELLCIMFPSYKWLCEYYHDNGAAWYKKYLNYYSRLI